MARWSLSFDSSYAPAVSAVIVAQVLLLTWAVRRLCLGILARYGDLALLNKVNEGALKELLVGQWGKGRNLGGDRVVILTESGLKEGYPALETTGVKSHGRMCAFAVLAIIWMLGVINPLLWYAVSSQSTLVTRNGNLAAAESEGRYVSSSLYTLSESSDYPAGENVTSLRQQLFKMVVSKEGNLLNAMVNTTQRDGKKKSIFDKFELRTTGLKVTDTGRSYTFAKRSGVSMVYAFDNYFSYFVRGTDIPLLLDAREGDYIGGNLAVSYNCGGVFVLFASSETILTSRLGDRVYNSSAVRQALTLVTERAMTLELFDYSEDEVAGFLLCANTTEYGTVCYKSEGACYHSQPKQEVCGYSEYPTTTSGLSYWYRQNTEQFGIGREQEEARAIIQMLNETFYSLTYGGDVVLYDEVISQLRIHALILVPLIVTLLALAIDFVASRKVLDEYRRPLSEILGGLVIDQVGEARECGALLLRVNEQGILNINSDGAKAVFQAD